MSVEMREDMFELDSLFQFTMKNKWHRVVEIYKKHPTAHTTKLTKSEETALHIALSTSDSISCRHVEQMIDLMEKQGTLMVVLSMRNVRGDTPLHLAAAVGTAAICERIALKDRQLIWSRNVNGETPLFVAAYHGNLQAFLCLHEIFSDQQDEALCRRKDGNTFLHAAISSEYLVLAYQIIIYYPRLINLVNVDDETPLHILARKPHIFKSSNHLGFLDSFIYHRVHVDGLKQQKYNPGAIRKSNLPGNAMYCPENYRTCVNLFFLFWTPICKRFQARNPILEKRNGDTTDLENQQHRERKLESMDLFDDKNGKSISDGSCPPNSITCMLFYTFVMKAILIALGIGFRRYKKIRELKVTHSHALQVMNRMIEFGKLYVYQSVEQRPSLEFLGIDIPDAPPAEHDAGQSVQSAMKTVSWPDKIEGEGMLARNMRWSNAGKMSGLVKKDTPILVAARMGISEIVKKIIRTYPGAFQDLDSNGKNALMLAVENRHSSVFDYLLKTPLPEYVFHQVDNQGNGILHLAAKMPENLPWRAEGAALQMQLEVKWRKHVERSVPPLFSAPQNKFGQSPENIFLTTHKELICAGNRWLIITCESCSVVATLIATVAFATTTTVPGGLDQQTGRPVLNGHKAFDVFTITSFVALCLSLTALVFFITIITSRYENREFKKIIPRKLLMGLTCLFASIAAMFLSFCAGHTFIMREQLRTVAVPIYAFALTPVTCFAIAQLPYFIHLLWAART